MGRRHSEIRQIGDLELDEHFGFERNSWRAQRIGHLNHGRSLTCRGGVLVPFGGFPSLREAVPRSDHDFDFVMLLIIAETTQQALLGEDLSLTNSFLLISTLLVLDRQLDFVKRRSSWFESLPEGRPLIILKEGKPLKERMEKSEGQDSTLCSDEKRYPRDSSCPIGKQKT